ncbi:class I SAM-dependent methyltransferase [Congregibacter litoralis]|uniref:Putative methyltransferase n=1 Tax=Congregibacter litoralis KT71 TaxID=314285 RepID=A4A500_9GAMM|nr:50S ribosomal protein L11 methyltransferase [Congregibacter litoralis]EAQ98871.2 putative methyltransferase [Congregibacter litoralis KT71]
MHAPANLQGALEGVLPGARLSVQSVLSNHALSLALIRDMAPQRQLDEATARRVMDNPLYWILCWASGRVLAAHVLENPELVRGKRVLDFGCGSGVVAIAAAMAGAEEVVACDIDPLALTATRHNAALNNVALSFSDDFEAVQGEVDLILVADVLYDKGNFPWLRRFVERADTVLIADSRVRDFAVKPYKKICEEISCTIPDMDEAGEFNRVSIYAASSRSVYSATGA